MVLHVLQARQVRHAQGELASSAAARMGSAAFFAPETRISPESGTPPWIDSFCMGRSREPAGPARRIGSAAGPLLGGQGLHRERVDLLAHALAQRRVDQLVPAHAGKPREGRAHDERLEMRPVVAADLDVRAGEPRRIDSSMDLLSAMAASVPQLVSGTQQAQGQP